MTIDLFAKKVGQNISRYRKAKSSTQKDFAKQAGISYRYFQSIESGAANLKMSTFLRVAEFLDVYPGDLLPGRHDF